MNKRRANEDLRKRMDENLRETNKLFCKEENRCRREVSLKSEDAIDNSGILLVTRDIVCKRRRQYFEKLIGENGSRDMGNGLLVQLD